MDPIVSVYVKSLNITMLNDKPITYFCSLGIMMWLIIYRFSFLLGNNGNNDNNDGSDNNNVAIGVGIGVSTVFVLIVAGVALAAFLYCKFVN